MLLKLKGILQECSDEEIHQFYLTLRKECKIATREDEEHHIWEDMRFFLQNKHKSFITKEKQTRLTVKGFIVLGWLEMMESKQEEGK